MNNLKFGLVALAVAIFANQALITQAAAPKPVPPKRLLLVTTTLGFRHAAVTLQEKLIREMAASTGEFMVVSTSDSPDFPTTEYQAIVDQRNARIPLSEAADNDKPPFLGVYGGLPHATHQQEEAVTSMMNQIAPIAKSTAAARFDLARAIFSDESGAISTKVSALATAELRLANVRSETFERLQSSPQRLSAEQIKVIAGLANGGGDNGSPTAAPPEPTPEQQAALTEMNRSLVTLSQAVAVTRNDLNMAPYSDQPMTKAQLKEKDNALESAQLAYANAASVAIRKTQGTSARLSPVQLQALAQTMGQRSGYGVVRPAPRFDPMTARVAKILQQYMNPEALKNYDAIAFLSTTGELPIPDKGAFFKWVADGHGFVGLHSATDTLHGTPEYINMVGGEFAGHGMFHARSTVYNMDPKSPLTAGWGASRTLNEEFYLFKKFDSRNVRVLLEMKKQPYTGEEGTYPVSWIKKYGNGRVFYTSLGHRDDVLFGDATIGDQEFKVRYNQPEIAKAVDMHILNGIRYALGILPVDATPQAP
jgi:type 1 glutamine amidotransferase